LQQDRWQGSLWLAPDFAILHGAVGATASHAHYAHQLMLSTGAPFTAQLDGIVHTARHLLVESLRPHAILAAPAPILTIYAEPQRLGGAALLAAAGGAGAPTLDGIAAALLVQPRDIRPTRACSGRWTGSTHCCPARSARPPWPRRRICR
jgi:hypothetical protein